MKVIDVDEKIRKEYDEKLGYYDENKTVKCLNCGAVLKYAKADKYYLERRRVTAYDDEDVYYVSCPHCKNKIEVE